MPNEYIVGRNHVIEALKSERPINKVFLLSPVPEGPPRFAESLAKNRGIPVMYVEKTWLDRITQTPHQGVAALTAVKDFCDVQDILEYAAELNEQPLIIVADEISDPNNLGAIIRSAEAVGAHGVIVPKRNAAGLSGAVARASAGAVEYMRVARVSNIPTALRNLKKQGIAIVGADAAGDMMYTECDFTGSVAVVIGGEHKGLGRLIGEICDFTVRLPIRGKITSLNASAAASVLLYEALRQRGGTAVVEKDAMNNTVDIKDELVNAEYTEDAMINVVDTEDEME